VPFEKIPFMMVCSCGLSSVHCPADFTWCRENSVIDHKPRSWGSSRSSIRTNPRTARSTTVAVISRRSGELSIKVPSSAGVSCPGGSYATVMGRRCGSRPRRYHRRHIRPKTPIGRSNGQLDRRKKPVNFSELGSMTNPLSQPTTAVSPSRKPSGRVI
jgi:hypothetical protein